MDKLLLVHIGRDDWDRPIYECNGRIYVDIDPRKRCEPSICTKMNNDFYGEPCDHLDPRIEIEFFPCRDTWN